MNLCVTFSSCVVCLICLPPSSSQHECCDKCWFLYDPSDNRSSYEDVTVTVPPDRTITGIVTIDGEFQRDITKYVKRDVLRFSKTDYDDPLVLSIDASFKNGRNQLVASGEATFSGLGKDTSYGAQYFDRPPYKMKIFPNTGINIQLSDMNITTDQCYHVYTGEPDNSEHWQYNYKSEETWQRFANIRLNTTTKITDTDSHNLTRYNFISVCADPQPVLCDTEHEIVIDAELGAEYDLTCTGSGAPYLSSKWDKDTYRPTFETHEEVIDNTTADNFIRSTLKIESFTVDHTGKWTCTISNLNFPGTVQKMYILQYNEPVSLMKHPSLEIYNPANGNTSLVWNVEGWPLEQINLDCNLEATGTRQIRRNTEQFYTKVPPRLTITLVLTTATTQGLINCRLLNVDEMIDNRTITKVGYNCKSGTYGEGSSCLYCPSGQISTGGSTECFPVSNSCPPNQFGVGEECKMCPKGTSTIPNGIAAKEHDCRNITDKPRGDPATLIPGIPELIVIISLIVVIVLVALIVLYRYYWKRMTNLFQLADGINCKWIAICAVGKIEIYKRKIKIYRSMKIKIYRMKIKTVQIALKDGGQNEHGDQNEDGNRK